MAQEHYCCPVHHIRPQITTRADIKDVVGVHYIRFQIIRLHAGYHLYLQFPEREESGRVGIFIFFYTLFLIRNYLNFEPSKFLKSFSIFFLIFH